MFDDDEDDFSDCNLNEDLEQFEAHLKGKSIGFLDSDRLEAIIDHYIINGQYSKAKSAADHGVYHFQYNPLFTLRKAQAMSGMGLLNDALELMNQIEKTNFDNPEVYLTKAALFSQLRDSKNAIRYFRLAMNLCEPEDRDEIFLDIAMEFQNLNQFKEAIEVLKEAIRINPSNEGALYEIAYCYDRLGDYQQAINCYTSFIDENPYSFTAWYNLGNAYSKSENFERSVWAYEYSILINPDFGPTHFNIGNAYLTMEKYHKALEHFHECIRLDGEDAMALCYIGEAHEQLNELDLAKHFYKRSLHLAPLLPEGWLGLGIVEDLMGNTREGIVMIHKALEYDPENAGIHHVLAGAYEKIEEIEIAIEHYEESLLLDPTDEDCLTDYIELLTEKSPLAAFDRLNQFMNEAEEQNKIARVLEVNLNWLLGNKDNAIRLFASCVEENQLKAKSIFEINPSLLDIPDFVNLAE
ncbi:MAG: tetratricopeptide repeat protein [Flavobacteriales bacterium]|nr:tetratricopeptide repeat protein [Flavobacteriales bacterium]